MQSNTILNITKTRQPFVITRSAGAATTFIILIPRSMVFPNDALVRCTDGHAMITTGGWDMMTFTNDDIVLFENYEILNQVHT